MKRHNTFYLLIVFILFLSGCATPNLKKVENPFTPYDRPGFSILSPAGDNWSFIEQTGQNSFSLVYLKKPDGQNHSVIATIDEVHGKFNFNSPEEFLNFEKSQLIESFNHPRYELIEEDIELDNKFGSYCATIHTMANDLKHRYNNETSRMRGYGYVFLHPNIADLRIVILYSERGYSFDMSPDFTTAAIEFTEGLNVK